MYELTLVAKGVNVSKVCKNELEKETFIREYQDKLGVLFLFKPYTIQIKYL